MIKKIKNSLVVLTSLSMLALPGLVSVGSAYALNLSDCASQGAQNFSLTKNCRKPNTKNFTTSDLNDKIHTVVNWFSIIVGIIAVIMIIVGGLKYITSGGDSNKVSGAKNTILFALVGLIIVALAQVIVHFVLNQSSDLTS